MEKSVKLSTYRYVLSIWIAAMALGIEVASAQEDLAEVLKGKVLESQEFLNAGNVEAIVAKHSEDAVLVLGGSDYVRGRDEIRNLYVALIEENPDKARTDAERVMVVETIAAGSEGNTAYYAGKFSETVNGEDGPVVTRGQFLALFKRENDDWTLIADMSAVAE